MTEVIVSEPPAEDPSVLAQAAVAAAALSGAAAAKAGDAQDDAAQAQAAAAHAEDLAHTALAAPSGISEEEARRVAREEAEAYVATLVAQAAATPPEPPAPTPPVDEGALAPPSVAKANKSGSHKTRFADRWLGIE